MAVHSQESLWCSWQQTWPRFGRYSAEGCRKHLVWWRGGKGKLAVHRLGITRTSVYNGFALWSSAFCFGTDASDGIQQSACRLFHFGNQFGSQSRSRAGLAGWGRKYCCRRICTFRFPLCGCRRFCRCCIGHGSHHVPVGCDKE